MAKNDIRPHEAGAYNLEKILGVALFISLALHVLASWVFLYVIPAYESDRRDRDEDIITVQLMGSLAPPAPAAPAAPVNPNLKGPDVVELPSTPPPPAPALDEPEPLVSAPADVIPIAPRPPEEPPVVKKTDTPPPKVTPPPKPQPKPQPKKPATPSLDARINQRVKSLERKVAAEDNPDDLINQRIANIAASRGQGQGEGSDTHGGATTGERLDPEKARYYSHIRDIVSKNWVAPASALSSNLSAIYQIKIEPDGRVSASRLRESSGNSDYDLSVERAVKQSSPFPPLPAVFGGKADNPALRFGLSDMRQGN